jgi:uncharacterized sulfatase
MLDSRFLATARIWTGILAAWTFGASLRAGEPPVQRPNILWITCEDMSPDLRCYGDAYAHTPAIDRLASQGARYTRVFTHAPVCAPSRSGLITGVYPTTLGTHHMRSRVPPPAHVRCFPAYLRESGYYCTNNSKTDYNFDVPQDAWDENGKQAHWRRRPRPDQPFFAVFNLLVTHESQARASANQYEHNTARLAPAERHDPSQAKLPAYYPDTPEVRRNWAVNCDNITALDYRVADLLKQLDDDGLADRTVVFFFSDHGRGLTRGKRWLYDSGLQVPLLVRWPGHIAAGTVVDDLTAFVDFAPTLLSIAGVEIPAQMQGQAFLGQARASRPREYIYAARDRMDERYDMIRAVRDGRFKYIRNFMPWLPYAQHVSYGEAMPILQEMRRLQAAGQLTGAPALFFRPEKPVEELFDCQADPDEVHNLADDPRYRDVLERLRAEQQRWSRETRDLGLLPEPVMRQAMSADPEHWRETIVAGGVLDRSLEVADLAWMPISASGRPKRPASWLLTSLADDSAAVRWWAAQALRARPAGATPDEGSVWQRLSQDPSPAVRTVARFTLAERSKDPVDPAVWTPLLEDDDYSVALQAALALDSLGEKARPMIDALKAANERKRENDFVLRVTAHALEQLGVEPAARGFL